MAVIWDIYESTSIAKNNPIITEYLYTLRNSNREILLLP